MNPEQLFRIITRALNATMGDECWEELPTHCQEHLDTITELHNAGKDALEALKAIIASAESAPTQTKR